MAYPAYPYGSTEAMLQINPQAQQWFSLADQNKSGRISYDELQRVLANGQGGNFSDKACRLMITMFDKQKKHSVDIVEFQALVNYINEWLAIFKNFDRDSSGSIQEEELSLAFSQMGYRFSQEFISFLIKKNNNSQIGSITVDQFIVLCVQVQKFTEEFKKRDMDQTGSINIGFEDFISVALSVDV